MLRVHPAPIPAAAKDQQTYRSTLEGEGGEVCGDKIKGGFPSSRKIYLGGGQREVLGLRHTSWGIIFSQRCLSSSDLWVGRLIPWRRQVMLMSHTTRNTCKAASTAFPAAQIDKFV